LIAGVSVFVTESAMNSQAERYSNHNTCFILAFILFPP